jgi:hypothetical protein
LRPVHRCGDLKEVAIMAETVQEDTQVGEGHL